MPLIEPKNSNNLNPSTENCRTCVDFKSWAKQQRKTLSTTEVSCRSNCEIIFVIRENIPQKKDVKKEETVEPTRDDCPWDKDKLGKSTWGLLHTMAAHYPDEPSNNQRTDMKGFFGILSRLYPCEYCAKDFRKE